MKLSTPGRSIATIEVAGTTRLNLSLAISEYEHARDLTSGQIQPAGISLTPLQLPIEDIAYRHIRNQEFDVAETSLAKYTALVAQGDPPVIGIPVCLARLFRHSAIYVRAGSGIQSPKDLEGRTVGIPEWAQTAGVYLRGLLSEYYGVNLERIQWVQASVNEPGRVEKVKVKLPPAIQYQARPDKCLSDMLASGEIDAALTARPPRSFLRGDAGVTRLFTEFRSHEQAYYRDTGIFPIMHIVSIRRSILASHPWVARNLFAAFEQAKDAAVARMREITTSCNPMPWGASLAEEVAEMMGGDLWPYGVDANRKTLDAFCRFAHDQHVTGKLLAANDLFPEEVLTAARV